VSKPTKEFFKGVCIVILLISVNIVVNAQDAQWRGPNRDGVFPDTLLLEEWPAGGPAILFVTEGLGRGLSSTVATKDMIYVTGMKDSIEYLSALDHSGKILWQKSYGPCWENWGIVRRTSIIVENGYKDKTNYSVGV